MKKNYLVFWILALVAIVLLAFNLPDRTGSVKGTVNPPDGAAQVWVLSATDTVRGILRNGAFEITGIKAGSCVVVVDGLPPYRTTTRTGIEVYEDNATDVGEILLEQ